MNNHDIGKSKIHADNSDYPTDRIILNSRLVAIPQKPSGPLIFPGLLIGFYRLTECIGRGGFSEVWSAWDEHLNRVVAVKIIPLTEGDGYTAIQFNRESTLFARLEHPHILPLYDFGETADYRFLVLRYVTGGSLAQRLELRRLSIPEILQLMIPIASTLDYLHEQRIVHRDLKPGNILIDAQGLPYLTDFGLAKSLSDTTTPMHSVSGTLNYMPPEQFTGGILSPQSDLYSFGIMLYQLFTGTLPNSGTTTFGMRQIIGNDVLPDIQVANPALPTKLNDYLHHLTSVSPVDRPTSVGVIMQAIADLFSDREDTSGTDALPGLILALESPAYRLHEAQSLLKAALSDWENDRFTLSATYYMLLNRLLPDLNVLITPLVRSLMIRGAFEYNEVSEWWDDSPIDVQQRACWNAIRCGNDIVRLRALNRVVISTWVTSSPPDIIEIVNQSIFPVGSATSLALDFLDHVLPGSKQWLSPLDTSFVKEDNNLSQLASSQPNEIAYSHLPVRASKLIGLKRRTIAAQQLSVALNQVEPLLAVYEEAGSLPGSIPVFQRVKITFVLAWRQLTRYPLEAFRQYLWAAAFSILSFALLILGIGWSRFLDFTQLLNQSLTYGVLYGLILGAGIWAARHISSRLLVAPRIIRLALGMLIGGVIVASAFSLFNQVALDNSIDGSVALYSGLLFAGGFAMGQMLPIWIQWLFGMSGIVLALFIPWMDYLQNGNAPVIDFGDLGLGPTGLLIFVVASIAALLTIGAKRHLNRISE